MPHWTRWRQRQNLTQAALAKAVGAETSSISHIEIGRRQPSLALLQRLCDELKLTPEERLEAAGLTQKQVA